MKTINLICVYCKTEFRRAMAEHNRRLRKYGNDYLIRCSKCNSVKHNKYRSPEYQSWSAMKNRCDNTNHGSYQRYGGRGIAYDPTWDDFLVFLKDMGEKPTPKHQLERKDNDKNYNKQNCIWATRKEQTRNRGGKRATRLYTYDGRTMCVKDWAAEVGISPASMQKRLNNGWPLEKAFAKQKHDGPKLYTFDNKTMSLTDWAEYLDVKRPTLVTRLQKGLPPEKVFSSEKRNRWVA